MTERYYQEVEELKKWLKESLKNFPLLSLTENEYREGTDCLYQQEDRTKRAYHSAIDYGFYHWLHDLNYELSHNQVCHAFFPAVKELGKLKII